MKHFFSFFFKNNFHVWDARSIENSFVVSKKDINQFRKDYPKFSGTIPEIMRLDKIDAVFRLWLFSKTCSLKVLRKVLAKDLGYFDIYKDETAKRYEFLYLIKKRHDIDIFYLVKNFKE